DDLLALLVADDLTEEGSDQERRVDRAIRIEDPASFLGVAVGEELTVGAEQADEAGAADLDRVDRSPQSDQVHAGDHGAVEAAGDDDRLGHGGLEREAV